jgi:threonine dehydrogenase-like Zn-dependent dehydrogenase
VIRVHFASRRIHIKEGPVPRRPSGFALIKLRTGGICNTDLELQRGYYGFAGTPGHEFVGEVVESTNSKWAGKRVVGEINLACGHCEWCERGLGRHCPKRSVLGIVKQPGAFREFFTLPETNLHEVPAHLSDVQAVFIEPLAAACEILDQVRIPSGETVAVLGDGKLGLLVAQVLKAKGYAVHQYGRHKTKLRIAEKAGIDVRVSGKKIPVATYDWVVEATGSRDGLQQAVRMTRPRGTIIMKSTLHGIVPIDTAPIIVNEITLVGSRCGRFEPAMELLASNRIDVTSMVSDEFQLKDARAAFARAAEKGALKVLLHG